MVMQRVPAGSIACSYIRCWHCSSTWNVAADEDLGLPGMLERCVKLITGVKKLVAEMRETVKNVVSHREKCAMILSAAMAASVALDQVLYHLHRFAMPPYPLQCSYTPELTMGTITLFPDL